MGITGSLGVFALKNYVARSCNPFLFPLYTRETWAIMLLGLAASMLQGRIIVGFMPFAILSMNYSKDWRTTLIGCALWSILCLLYWAYMVVKIFP